MTIHHRRAVNIVLAVAACAVLPGVAQAQEAAPVTIQQPNADKRRLAPDEVRRVAPALEQYTQQRLYGEVWKRPGLSPRDRSMVTVAAMIARGEASALGYYADQAIANGVKPVEISEAITHLAFYAGWGRAMAAVEPVGEVFARRGVRASDLPPAFGPLDPLDVDKDTARAAGVSQNVGSLAPGIETYTNGLLFRELWQRPYLAQRDRSLVTIAALIAGGHPAQLSYHLGRGMDRGLTEAQVGEMLTQLAFYAGWPAVFDAIPVIKRVFAERAEPTKGR